MTTATAVALVLALVSTMLTNVAYLREHDAAAALPVLSMRRPLQSVRILLADRSWMLGFAMESAGFLEVTWTPYSFGIAGLFRGKKV